jgi:RimJ/RimL family protein N-acetyltransferase
MCYGNSMRIEDLTADRIPGYHACVSAVIAEGPYLSFTEPFTLDATRAWVQKTFFERRFPCVVALDGATVVGWADLIPLDRSIYAHVAVLGMGVVASSRGHGIGGALIDAVIERARRAGMERIELDVFAKNKRARALYERRGFLVEGVKRRRAKRGAGDYDDVIEMALLLDAAA